MTQDDDLSDKTFDQQFQILGDNIIKKDISPNRRIPAEIVFEPMGSGVRVTVRDEKHRVLWGYVGSVDSLKEIHCLVATYGLLRDLLAEELKKRGLFREEVKDPKAAAEAALDKLEETVKWLRDGLKVKKVSGPALERAREIARVASDANCQISLDAGSLKGMKPRTEQDKTSRKQQDKLFESDGERAQTP